MGHFFSKKKTTQSWECPICEREFKRGHNINAVGQSSEQINIHLDWCMQQQERNAIGEEKKSEEFDEKKEFRFSVKKEMKSRSLKEKEGWFQQQMNKKRIDWRQGCEQLFLWRGNAIQNCLSQLNDIDLRKELKINFEGENAQDAGGLIRQWTNVMLEAFYDPELKLFVLTETDKTFVINRKSHFNPNHIELFQLFGKVVGKALFERIPSQLNLHISLYKQLLDLPVSLYDLSTFDQVLHNSLKFVKDSNIESQENSWYQQYFAVEVNVDGIKIQEELIEGGSSIKVDNSNKAFFVDLMVNWEMTKSVEEQLKALKKGFFSIIPQGSIQGVFSAPELELMICGNPFIDLNDWFYHTQYENGFTKDSTIIKNFWEILSNYDQDKLSKFLFFCTGTSKVPLGGFKMLESNRGEYKRFTIRPAAEKLGPRAHDMPLPIAHTCFNRLELPKYKSKEVMEQAIDYVTMNEAMGYGLV